MSAKPRFSMLLYTDSEEQGKIIANLMKPIFPLFFVAHNEEQALKTIAEENIDILFMGFLAIADSEKACAQLFTNNAVDVARIIKRKFLFCKESEIRFAFSACNKDEFDDYFVTQPLSDPYRIFIRMRFLMRLFRKEEQEQLEREARNKELRIDDMCAFFDRIIHCEQTFTEMNEQHFTRLCSSIATAVEILKKSLAEVDMSDSHRSTLLSLIEQQTEKSLLDEVESQQLQQGQMSYRLKNVSESAQVKKQQAIAPIDIDFGGLKVLVVEDDVDTRETIEFALTEAGCHVQTAGSARGASEQLNAEMSEVMLLDLTLPDMSPFFVISQAMELNSKLKIFLLARPIDRDNVEECLKAGASDVIIKPIDGEVLLYKLQALLGLS